MNTEMQPNHGSMNIITYDAGRSVSRGSVVIAAAHLNGALLPAAKVGGVGTEPEYRRQGLVREFFIKAWEYMNQEGALISFLHPFSFSYYRRMGYERVSDHRILEFPMHALDFVPRYAGLVRCSAPEHAEDLAKVYNRFAQSRNILFPRCADNAYMSAGNPNSEVYLLSDASGEPEGYLILDREQSFCVNRMLSISLHVREICFTSREALLKLFGFLRMYEGQMDQITIHNAAMAPEIELVLRHYTHTKITVIPDIAARVHDVEKVLCAIRYPDAPGCFTVRVFEPAGSSHSPEKTDGCWKVSYANGRAKVEKLENDAPCDLICDIPAFTRLIFGYESFGADTARYMDNVTLCNECTDFFRAFTNRPCGLFEHF